MEKALRTWLFDQPGVSALIGTRAYWGERPQAKPLPAVSMNKISGIRTYTTRGPDGLVSARLQFDCWGKDYDEAKGVAQAVIAALSGAHFEQDGVKFRGCFIDGEQDGREDKAGGGRISRTRIDVLIWHNGD